MTTEKTIALTRWTFVGKVMSLLFNMLSRLVIAFLPRSKQLLISWLQSPSGAQEDKVCHCFHCFPIYPPWSDETGCHDLHFLNVEFSLFQKHKRRLYTWTSPDGQYQNQFDYILCSQRWRNNGNSERLYFLGLQNHTAVSDCSMKLKDACSLEEKLWPT